MALQRSRQRLRPLDTQPHGALISRTFDATQKTLTGNPVVVAEEVAASVGTGRAAFSVSRTGSVVYLSGVFGLAQLTWVNRSGLADGTIGEEATLSTMALSRDGTRVVYGRRDNTLTQNLWVTDVKRRGTRKLTFGQYRDSDGTWSPDASRVIYASIRPGGGKALYEVPAAGGPERLLYAQKGVSLSADEWSPDGRFINQECRSPLGRVRWRQGRAPRRESPS